MFSQEQFREERLDTYGTYLVSPLGCYTFSESQNHRLSRLGNIAMVSQPTWEQTFVDLQRFKFNQCIVLTPELITVAGMDWDDPLELFVQSKRAINQSLMVSRRQPEATFIIGSPFYKDGGKPFNSALVIRNGKVLEVARKKLLDNEELATFFVDPNEPPLELGDSTILICRDLIGARIEKMGLENSTVEKYVNLLTEDAALANRFKETRFVGPSSKRLLICSCWGVSDEEISDMFYFTALATYCNSILEFDKNIDQIIVCDRAPTGQNYPSTQKPLSAVFSRF